MIPLVFGALGMAVGAVAGAFTAHAAGEKDRQAAKHHKQIANELTNKYASLTEQYYELVDESKKQVKSLTDQLALSEVEKDCLRLAVRLQQNLIFLMWEIDREPTVDALNSFQSAVEQTNQVLLQLQEELIIVPDDYYTRILNTIEITKEIKIIIPSDIDKTNILSVDLGRAFTKTCISCEPNSVVFIPANVKRLSLEQVHHGVFESTVFEPLNNLWMEYEGNAYAFGQLAVELGANLGVGQSKLEDGLFKVLTSAAYFELEGNISVVLSLPYLTFEQFEREKTQLIKQVSGSHLFNFRGQCVSLNITKVWVMPEGYGSLLWAEAQPKKYSTSPYFTKISVAIVDIGLQNIDLLMVDNFQFVKYISKSEDFGMNKFYELIAADIEGADSQSLTLISAVNKPKGKRFYRPKGASQPANLDDFLPNLIEQFSREICSRVLAWLPERVSDVIVTGGGGEFYWEDIQRMLKDAKVNTHLAAPARQANALGQYIYGEVKLRFC
jgi:plasmid segregation protein ParM